MGKVDNYILGMDCGTTNIKAVILPLHLPGPQYAGAGRF